MIKMSDYLGEDLYKLAFEFLDKSGSPLEVFYYLRSVNPSPEERSIRLKTYLPTSIEDKHDMLVAFSVAQALLLIGDESGVPVLNDLIDARFDLRVGGVSPHRLYGYEQVYEEILQDADIFLSASSLPDDEKSRLIKPLVERILYLSEVEDFLFDYNLFMPILVGDREFPTPLDCSLYRQSLEKHYRALLKGKNKNRNEKIKMCKAILDQNNSC